jgi:hypothetical protein
MKIVELINRVSVVINNEQADLLNRFNEEESISKNSLNEREQILANQLTMQDLLLRRNENGKIIYKKKA